MSAGFEQLRELVLADAALVARLAPLDRDALFDALLALAAERGLDVARADLEEARRAAGREWHERWT